MSKDGIQRRNNIRKTVLKNHNRLIEFLIKNQKNLNVSWRINKLLDITISYQNLIIMGWNIFNRAFNESKIVTNILQGLQSDCWKMQRSTSFSILTKKKSHLSDIKTAFLKQHFVAFYFKLQSFQSESKEEVH